jgi:uncharacterized protein with NRDE domain
MCLILLAWRVHPRHPLVVAANRDEFHARSADRAAFWRDAPDIVAGRDLEAGGTWMGASRQRRFAAVTNYRGGRDARADYVAGLSNKLAAYSGFNLLVCDGRELWWLSNRDGGSRRLEPGIYGLGNFLLDTPEVDEPKARFSDAIEPTVSVETLFTILAGSLIVAPQYGTRCSTVLVAAETGAVTYAERAFDPAGAPGETVRFDFRPRA